MITSRQQKISSIILIGLLTLIFLTTISNESTNTTSLDPSVFVSDQKIDNNTVYVDQVICTGPAWIAIHNVDNNQKPSTIVGYTHLEHGVHSAVPISISSSHTSSLIAMLHIDNGTIGQYNGTEDPPVKDVNNYIVQMEFNAEPNYYPHIVISNQQIIGDTVVIDLVEFNETSGWVAIHSENSEGGIGDSIGHTLLHQGISLNVLVPITGNNATDNLTAMLHFDKGTIGVWEPSNDQPMYDEGNQIMKGFGVGGTSLIQGPTNTLNLNSLISSPMVLHIIFSIISAFILVLVGTINFSRNRSNKLNQLFLGFYTFIGLFQFFDAFLMLLGTSADPPVLNFFRDLMIGSLLLGLSFGVLGVLLIYFGENFILSKKAILAEFVILLVVIIIGLLNDSISVTIGVSAGYGSSGAHLQPARTLLGWMTISGYYVLALIVITVFLIRLITDSHTGPDLKTKLIRLLIGLVLSISFLLLFDLSFAVDAIVAIVLNNYVIHFLVHTVIVIGALFILSAYVTTLEEKT